MGDSAADHVTPPDSLQPFLVPLAAIQRALDSVQQQGIVIGGVAASLLGRPRLTADIDLLTLIEPQDVQALMTAARKEGIVPRHEDAVEFAARSRMLLLRHEDSDIQIDISLGMLPFEVETVERSAVRNLGQFSILLPSPEDLIIQKAIASRPKDLDDIEKIAETNPDLDVDRVEYWVGQFAEALEMPELLEAVQAILTRTNR